MPCLIPEILFEIGKELVKSGDSEAVLKFGLSGTEPLKALMNVFASITTLKLYENNFAVGWDDNCFTLDRKIIPKAFIYSIGGAVKKLHIELEIDPFFQPIIDQIADKKQLTSFSAGKDSFRGNITFLQDILPTFSSTLKDLKLPPQAVIQEIRDSLQPESLTLLNCFYFDSHVFDQSFNQFYSQVKTLNFNSRTGSFYRFSYFFEDASEMFSKLENLHFVMEYDARNIKKDIETLIKLIKKSNVFSPKLSYTVKSNHRPKTKQNEQKNIRICKHICADFVYDDSDPNFYHFSQSFQSSINQDVIFEVFILKNFYMLSECNTFLP